MKYKYIYFFIFSIINFASVQAQYIQSFGVLDGLTSENIRALTKDDQGTLWAGTTNGLYKYQGYGFIQTPLSPTIQNPSIKTLYNKDNGLWVGTLSNGLFIYKNQNWSQIFSAQNANLTVYSLDADDLFLYIGTNKGLFVYSIQEQKIIQNHPLTDKYKDQLISVVMAKKKYVYVATKGHIHQYHHDYSNNQIIQLNNPEAFIHDILIDNKKHLWVGTNESLLKYDLVTKKFINKAYLSSPARVLSLASNGSELWASTLSFGILSVNLETDKVNDELKIVKNNQDSYEKFITVLHLSVSNLLWVGTFESGLSAINLESRKFGFLNLNQEKCSTDYKINDFKHDNQGNLWMVNNEGLIKTKDDLTQCEVIDFSSIGINEAIFKSLSIIDTEIWLSTSKGVIIFDPKTNQKRALKSSQPLSVAYFTYKNSENEIYIGTSSGLKLYNTNTQQINDVVTPNIDTSRAQIYDFALDSNRSIYFHSSMGVFRLDNQGQLHEYYADKNIFALYIDQSDQIYVSINNKGLFKIDKNKNLQEQFLENDTFKTGLSINSIEEDNANNLWMGSNLGLIRFDKSSKNSHIFSHTDGTNNHSYIMTSSYKDKNGKLYFGGNNGLIHFKPEHIKLNQQPMNVILTNLYLSNQIVIQGESQASGFILEEPIDRTQEIQLGYKDIMLEIEFAGLDFADSSRNKYAYRLQGFNDQWKHTTAQNRQATYTNLNPGNYTFQVKASNKDGIWSERIKSIDIKMYPAPWFSIWAYMLYAITFIVALLLYIRYKTHSSRKRAKQLEKVVLERTHEVNTQKKVVESLLVHKNEVFANITHEFKTPITLILGPIKQLLKEAELVKHHDKLSMASRNANRLLVMVGHILKLSQSDEEQRIDREAQALDPILLMLCESFNPLAIDKNIELVYQNQPTKVSIMASPDSLEIVISNLMSNALKFTATGGKITLFTKLLSNNQVSITIKDSGSGINEQDLEVIFNRFNRQNIHKNIQGTGLGLSVVKTLVEGNKGHILVNSQIDEGSEFTVVFPICHSVEITEIDSQSIEDIVENTRIELNEVLLPKTFKPVKNKVNILVIEDNSDMQIHIHSVLKNEYNCSFANRGKTGIAIALKEIPDIIICDVMMPEMDGYQVAGILRTESKTSHIPIILLTALNTKESRIKGWRANIDMYMTKPFDSSELLSRLENILSIRKILQENTNKNISSNTPSQSLDISPQDLKFINKLKSVIKDNYHNEFFLKPQLSSKMAYSESQLLRKVKALIDKNPMDMLRDYRLEMAVNSLKQGYQVGIVSDNCGFNSLSYFGRCFKNKYGMTPKQYQKLHFK